MVTGFRVSTLRLMDAIIVAMFRSTFLALTLALACGGTSADGTPEPAAQPETPLAVPLSPVEPSFSVDLSMCSGASAESCTSCVQGPIPRCLDVRDSGERSEPASCRNPNCEVPVSAAPPPPFYLAFEQEPRLQVQGTCSDGKRFEASFDRYQGHVLYRRDGALVGSASYTPQVGDCACSGESWGGDVRCTIVEYEALVGDLGSTELLLPFANGQRTSPCVCRD